MNIDKAERGDLQEILDLQYLAYQSEARLFNNMDIPPLNQTLEDVIKLLLCIESEFPGYRYELFTSTKSKSNIELYEKLGYIVFYERNISEELSFVYMEK